MYVTAYGAVLCSPAAVLLSGIALAAGVLLFLLQTLILRGLYQPSPGGPITCAG
jgi:hypothetical protein